jgi:predicted metal-dependent HD superfamily phosphohydrolase
MNRPDILQGIAPAAFDGCDEALFRIARESYDSPGRHYHAWSHIEACLNEFKHAPVDQPRAVLLAILFHDAIYVPGRRDNEERSAQLALDTLVAHSRLGADERDEVAQLIRLTASHHAHRTLLHDEAVFLDIDLSVLGADEATYRAYADGVRREFVPAAVTAEAFVAGRSRFLQGLVAQDHIFATAWMRSRREAAARRNIAAELQELAGEALRS